MGMAHSWPGPTAPNPCLKDFDEDVTERLPRLCSSATRRWSDLPKTVAFRTFTAGNIQRHKRHKRRGQEGLRFHPLLEVSPLHPILANARGTAPHSNPRRDRPQTSQGRIPNGSVGAWGVQEGANHVRMLAKHALAMCERADEAAMKMEEAAQLCRVGDAAWGKLAQDAAAYVAHAEAGLVGHASRVECDASENVEAFTAERQVRSATCAARYRAYGLKAGSVKEEAAGGMGGG